MKQNKSKYKYTIIGCDHSFVPEQQHKLCSECSLTIKDNECLDSIMVGERYYVYKREVVK